MLKMPVIYNKTLILLLICTAATIASAVALTSLTTTTTTIANVYGQTGSMATLQNIGATYAVSIVPGGLTKPILFIIILLQLQFLLILL